MLGLFRLCVRNVGDSCRPKLRASSCQVAETRLINREKNLRTGSVQPTNIFDAESLEELY
jgi:hypothetical protein